MSRRIQAGTTPKMMTMAMMASSVSSHRGSLLGSAGGVVGMETPAIRPHATVFQNAPSR
jgi:hypothetical protein